MEETPNISVCKKGFLLIWAFLLQFWKTDASLLIWMILVMY